MSEQEKKSGASATGGSPVVMVEKSTASRHKQPYRPTDLQDEAPPDLHHKRSRAPAVPSVAEELKDPENSDLKERKEAERAICYEKTKQNVAKKLSSNIKRRASSPEEITLAPLEVETKIGGTTTPPSQPIPAQVASVPTVSDITEKTEADKKGDEDSITEEIAELRTPEASKKITEWDNPIKYVSENQEPEDVLQVQYSPLPLQRKLASELIKDIDIETEKRNDDWILRKTDDTVPLQRKISLPKSEILNEVITSTHELKKKEISWSDATYLDKIPLQDLRARSASWMLDRKASVGPCYRKSMPFGEPSGITISLPKKSLKNINDPINPIKSGISITVSKRCFDSKSRSPMDFELNNIDDRVNLPMKEKKVELKIEEDNYNNFFGNLRGKIDNLCGKIKHALHI